MKLITKFYNMFLFTNRLGNSFEVTEEQKEKILHNGYKESDFVEVSESEDSNKEEFTDLQVLRAEYKQKFGKNVPPNKTKDVEWITEKLSSNE